MFPPISLNLISRPSPNRDIKRKLYIFSEGTLTEPSFLNSVLSRSNFFRNINFIDFYFAERTGSEFGINTVKGMIKLAYKNIIENSNVHFRKKKDKIIMFFDLDIYHESFDEIKRIIEENKKYFIFVFVNPAIELFLLLCKENSYEEIIERNLNSILKNERVVSTGRRFIHQLLIDNLGVDPKNSSSNFDLFANGLEIAIRQEKMFISSKLSNPKTSLISNFGYILEKIKNNSFDDIDYLLY